MTLTIDKLVDIYWDGKDETHSHDGMRRVVRALRDEFYHDMDPRVSLTPSKVALLFNEILGEDPATQGELE